MHASAPGILAHASDEARGAAPAGRSKLPSAAPTRSASAADLMRQLIQAIADAVKERRLVALASCLSLRGERASLLGGLSYGVSLVLGYHRARAQGRSLPSRESSIPRRGPPNAPGLVRFLNATYRNGAPG
ncbi:hypothetical protein predicted by Glimmer/Critica [Sorangium cellulosum So ce56]|uniref:Uncharacterized protein n=1 Tax=Sorangium cellulosum (strain So ce56) TaxID=448385 RepID=A9ENT8_SORC5|nr:hypothetical protein predicted by Glimmer/Critica [Sorangium cellulosum So ce56]